MIDIRMGLVGLVNNLSRRTQVYTNEVLAKYELSSGTYPFLLLLDGNEGINQNQASRALSVDKAASARAVKTDEKLDIRGAVFFILSVVALFTSLLEGQEVGYTNPVIICGFVIAVVSTVVFLLTEVKVEVPLVELRLFENSLFSLSIFCGFISFIALSSPSIIQPFFFQDVLKLSPGVTGLFMMTFPTVMMIVAPISGHLSDKIGSEFLTLLGLLGTSAGLFLMSTLNEHSHPATIVLYIAIMSAGNGLFQSPNNSLVMSTVPRNRLGIASSVNALIRNLGVVFGITLSTTLLYNRMSARMGARVVSFVEGREDVFVYGMKYVYTAAAIICLAGALLTAYRLYGRKFRMPVPAEEQAKN